MPTISFLATLLLSALAASAILVPLLRPSRREQSRREHDLSVYRDQLDEIDRDLAAGLIAPAQAAAARAEIERRVLKAADREGERGDTRTGGPLPRTAAWALAVAVPVLALLVYLPLGSPGMPDVPHAARPSPDPGQMAEREEFERLTARLAERLRAGEGDLRGWVMLARSYRALGEAKSSADAFRRAVEMAGGLDGADPRLLEEFGEMVFIAANGLVTPEAKSAFEAALRRQPGLFKARHYLAVAHAQAGEAAEALAIWRGMELDSPEGAPWLPELRRRIETVAAEAGISLDEIEPERAGEANAMPAPAGPVAKGPTRADIEAAAAMSPEERMVFIRGMVERLAERLESSPEDPEGWARLAHAYSVLGEEEKATDARQRAVSQFRKELESLPPASPRRAVIETRLKALDG